MSGLEERLSLVFDLDGTLVNSMPMILDCFAYAIEEFQEPVSRSEMFQRLAGPADICLRNLLEDERNLEKATERFLEYNQNHKQEVVPFEGAVEMLDFLVENEVETSLWTGRDRKTAEEILQVHDLERYFGKVVCGDDLRSFKPDPEGLVRILERRSLESSEVLLVGDSDVDVLAGHACQVSTMLIRHNRSVSEKIRELCFESVETPQQAYQIISAKVSGETAAGQL